MSAPTASPNIVAEIAQIEADTTPQPSKYETDRKMVGISIKDWARYTKQIFDHVTPSGLAKISEHSFGTFCADDSIPSKSAITTYLTALNDGLEMVGLPIRKFSGEFFKEHMENAGFVDVHVRTFSVPWGTWPKNKQLKYMGAVALEIMTTGAEAYGMQLFTRVLGIPEEKARKMMEDHVAGIRSGKEHRCHRVWQVVGKKPVAE